MGMDINPNVSGFSVSSPYQQPEPERGASEDNISIPGLAPRSTHMDAQVAEEPGPASTNLAAKVSSQSDDPWSLKTWNDISGKASDVKTAADISALRERWIAGDHDAGRILLAVWVLDSKEGTAEVSEKGKAALAAVKEKGGQITALDVWTLDHEHFKFVALSAGGDSRDWYVNRGSGPRYMVSF